MSESVTKTAIGQCVEISERNGWTAFSIDVGSNYPVKLSTKQAKIIEEARGVGSAVATWTYKEQESEKINENTGKPFVNRYLDKVELGSQAPATTASGSSQPLPEPHHAAIAPSDRDRTITRMACIKAACDFYSGRDVGLEYVVAAADRFEIHVYRDIDDPLGEPDDVPF